MRSLPPRRRAKPRHRYDWGFGLLALLVAATLYRGYERWVVYPAYPEPLDSAKRYPCTIRQIVDGDTLVCREGHERVRLLLIDAPEIEQAPFGAEAAQHLEALAPQGSVVQLEIDRRPRDKYGRLLAYVWGPDDHMINEALVRDGYAITFSIKPNVKYRDTIRQAERDARADHVGLWAVDGFRCKPVAFRYGRCE